MRISRLLILSIFLYLIVLWGLFAYNGGNWLVNFSSVVMMTIVSIIFILILIIYPDKHPMLLLFIIITFMYFNLRILALIMEPERLYDQFTPASADDMNMALIYLCLGIIFSVAGLFVGNRIFPLRRTTLIDNDSERNYLFSQPLVFISGVLLLAEINVIYTYMVMGLSRHGIDVMNMPTMMKVIYTLTDTDIFLMFFLVVVLERWSHLSPKIKMLSMFAIIGYVLMRVIISSKAGIYYPVLFWLFYKLSRERDFKVNVKKITMIMLPLFILAVLSFNVAKQLRQNWMDTIDQEITFESIYENLGEKDRFSYLDVLTPLHRLQGIDPLINIINEKGINVDKYINLTNEIKSFMNLVLPGKPFRVPLTSQSYVIVYGSMDESLYLDYGVYTTYIFTMWGLYYALFGAFGGLLGMFFFMLTVTAMYNVFANWNSKYRIFLMFLCIYAAYWNFISFGFDFFMDVVCRTLLQGSLFIMLLHIVSAVKRRRSVLLLKKVVR
ncbi:MAG: hypothetical protein VR68_09175 [Peptococcaceae bacterium BRH_c4a]|nr:MAG: hypothetical protein VR68_09175 [Peptococcaceae bacterium BRH_c4a]